MKAYLEVRDAFFTMALKHTRVLALSGMTQPSIELFRTSLAAQTKRNPSPIDMYFYSDYKLVRYVDATLVIPSFLNSLIFLELYLEMVLSRWKDSTH